MPRKSSTAEPPAAEEPADAGDAPQEPEPERPPSPPPRGIAFSDISRADLAAVTEAASDEERIALLCKVLGVRYYDANPRTAIFVDYCLYGLVFAKEAGMDEEKTSCLFSLLRRTFEHATGGERPALEDNFAFFKDLLLRHSAERPPEGVGIFAVGDVRRITEFITSTFYRHYRAYTLAFEVRQGVFNEEIRVAVQTPLAPPPLSEATEEEAPAAAEGSAQGSAVASAAEEDDSVSQPTLAAPVDFAVEDAAAGDEAAPPSGGASAEPSAAEEDDALRPHNAPDLPPELRELVQAEVDARVAAMQQQLEAREQELQESLKAIQGELESVKAEL